MMKKIRGTLKCMLIYVEADFFAEKLNIESFLFQIRAFSLKFVINAVFQLAEH